MFQANDNQMAMNFRAMATAARAMADAANDFATATGNVAQNLELNITQMNATSNNGINDTLATLVQEVQMLRTEVKAVDKEVQVMRGEVEEVRKEVKEVKVYVQQIDQHLQAKSVFTNSICASQTTKVCSDTSMEAIIHNSLADKKAMKIN